ncbi:MAG: hypothetical protein GX994_05095 [Firmicutes bacterium]|nr:hypothetical protein [Bacillota bacterium]
MNEYIQRYLRENYRFSLSLVLALQNQISFAISMVALIIVCAFAFGAYEAFIKNNFFGAIVGFVLSLIQFLFLRRIIKSSQQVIKETKSLMKAFSSELPEFRDDTIEKLESEVAKMDRFEKQ